jgi:hypothetical protein
VNIKTTLKSSVAAAALFAIAAPVAPSVNAADDTLKSGNKNSLTISGQVVRALFYADDGQSDALFNSDGSITGTRIRWVAKGTVNANVTAGAMIEMDLPRSNPQASLTLSTGNRPLSTETADSASWGTRQQFVWVANKRMGKLSLGQTNAASNGRSETTFSGVNMVSDSGGVAFGSGVSFVDTTGGTNSISSTTVNAVFNNMDGLSRADVLRYDTPRFGGLALATSYIGGGDWDIGGDYRAKAGAIKLRVQAQYNNTAATSATQLEETSLSAAVLHDSGFNGAIAFGKRHIKGSDDPRFLDFDIGYRAKIYGIGGTNFSLNVQHTDDLSADNTDGRSLGFTVAQIFTPIGASVAVTYKNYSFDTASNTFEDIDVLSLQTVFKF